MRTAAALSTELQNLPSAPDVVQGALNLATAYGEYMKDAISNGVPAEPTFIDSTCVPAIAEYCY